MAGPVHCCCRLRRKGCLVRAVVQRVSRASVVVDQRVVGAIKEPGLLVFVGAATEDTLQTAAKMAAKLWGLRILRDELSCSDTGAPLLVISQFTLYAEPLVDAVVSSLRALGARVETGIFGADMEVSLVNDGPVTLLVDL